MAVSRLNAAAPHHLGQRLLHRDHPFATPGRESGVKLMVLAFPDQAAYAAGRDQDLDHRITAAVRGSVQGTSCCATTASNASDNCWRICG